MKRVYDTILDQLGGRQFLAMVGPRNLTGRSDGLAFWIGKNRSKANHVEITLTGDDEYFVRFRAVRRAAWKEIFSAGGIDADNLRRTFELVTGLRTSLTETFSG